MNKGTKIAILATAALATVMVPLTSASADGWRGDRYYRHRYHNNNSDAWAAGAVGLAAGALLGTALAQPREPEVIYRCSQWRSKKDVHRAIDSQAGHASEAGPNRYHSTQPRIVVFIWASADPTDKGKYAFPESSAHIKTVGSELYRRRGFPAENWTTLFCLSSWQLRAPL